MNLADKLLAYYLHKGYKYSDSPFTFNIAYIEGANWDGTANADEADKWNDRRILFTVQNGLCKIVMNVGCTTEPGKLATNSTEAAKLGGVARIAFGQYTAWQMGFHKGRANHPALVQCSPIPVYRDANKDGKRTGDLLDYATGINQHGTRPGKAPDAVGNWSAGCLVGQYWPNHLEFIRTLKQDARYISDNKFVFTSAIIDGDAFASFMAFA